MRYVRLEKKNKQIVFTKTELWYMYDLISYKLLLIREQIRVEGKESLKPILIEYQLLQNKIIDLLYKN